MEFPFRNLFNASAIVLVKTFLQWTMRLMEMIPTTWHGQIRARSISGGYLGVNHVYQGEVPNQIKSKLIPHFIDPDREIYLCFTERENNFNKSRKFTSQDSVA